MKRWLMYLALVGFILNFPVATATAHEGHAHKTMGTVTTVNGNHLEVKDVKGVVTMHMLDSKTKIKRGKTVLTAVEIKTGDRVVISTLESKDKAGNVLKTVTEVEVGAAAMPATKK